MNRIYMSFLGAGKYKEAVYSYGKKKLKKTKYVQAAEIEYFGPDGFDRYVFIMTPTSKEKHWAPSEEDKNSKPLRDQILEIGVSEYRIQTVEITEELEPDDQWSWFEKVLNAVEKNTRLVIDMTHGFRAVAIVISSAIGYLQRVRNVELEHVLYGAYDAEGCPIVDMKDFYVINEWSDAVSRLVETADAGKIAQLAQKADSGSFKDLNNSELIDSLLELTGTLRNIEVNKIADTAGKAITRIEAVSKDMSQSVRQLLTLVINKFTDLATEKSASGKYDESYFRTQLAIVRMLIDHNLFMQAYTVMREMIAAIGMVGFIDLKKIGSKGERKKRNYYGEFFVRMIQFSEEEWNFNKEDDIGRKNSLLPYYKKCETNGVVDKLRKGLKDLIMMRNGFDHAWTARDLSTNVRQTAEAYLNTLTEAVDMMKKNEFFSESN